ncbi:fimbria/pilus outer membrane usher protein [Photorhabdus bodei]|uniref:Fimbria/pilus outer membrane usher protein n=1 Tax=Photorhabdus bodei TaxID=2029681 RepID=A0A329WV90_9GAMM|nr:fimbria/pilus outer membrane usher protein [Photorhabdus bodei]NDL00494.1 fimbria/pilus outer membrane usher protein [Photorhabdus bodei]NDL04628.1 fimbria/pilus outer membrane usher protein [Photorhabdus bodei]NDL08953.1 fimbria/pilus outer membrane usher protein [Photorhabdus bodei]RAX08484.1 usher protein FimD [Photorhabdus bodei]
MIRQKISPLALIIGTLLYTDCLCYAKTFNTDFLVGESAKADLSRFYTTSELPAGRYGIDIYLNNDWKGRFDINIQNDGKDIYLLNEDLPRLGIKIDKNQLPESNLSKDEILLTKIIHEGTANLDVPKLSLHLVVPQAYIKNELKGYIDPAFWDRGIPGAMLSYNANYYHTQNRNKQNRDRENEDNAYVSLNSGLNLFGWQLRDQSSYHYTRSNGDKWSNNTRYLQRGISSINSEFRIGDSYTSSDLFDSFRFRGINLKTDMRMYPDAWQGFSPIVRGVARTNALVKIIQNNIVIYQGNVPPGPFAIDAILPTGSGGDLLVEVTEADGRTNSFTVPFSSVPNMMKEGLGKYDISAGKTHIANSRYKPNFFQASYQYGFNNVLTGYTGTIISKDYYSLLLGSGFNLPIGAVSIDVSQSSAKFNSPTMKGQSYKLAYSRYIPQTKTNFSLAAYRYSTKNYLTLIDAIDLHDWISNGYNQQYYSHQKNTFNINLNQNLGSRAGSLFLSGTFRDYWGTQNKSREYQMGYSNSLGKINYSLTASRVRYNINETESKEEQRYYLMLSVPFELFGYPAYLTNNVSINESHYDNSNLGLSGSAGPNNRLNYHFNISDQKNGSTTTSANLTYKTSVSTLSSSYSQSKEYRQMGLGATGSLVAYRSGILAANQVGETFAIIDAPGTANASVNGDKSMVTNNSGKLLIPYLSPYRKNAIMLDTSEVPEDAAELIGNIRDVAPYSGAITHIGFKTDQRKTFIFYAAQADGKPLPFGTEIVDSEGNSLGYVGQGSMVFLRVEKLPQQIYVHIGQLGEKSCIINNPQPEMGSTANICR